MSDDCKYLNVKDISGFGGDVFDHPNYKFFCRKSGEEKEILGPRFDCKNCSIGKALKEKAMLGKILNGVTFRMEKYESDREWFSDHGMDEIADALESVIELCAIKEAEMEEDCK